LFENGIFVRIRNQTVFEIKYNADLNDFSHMSCEEYNFDWPLSTNNAELVAEFLSQFIPNMNALDPSDVMGSFGLQELVTIRKTRKTYAEEGLRVFIDDVEGLGTFVEIEAIEAGKFRAIAEFCETVGLHHIPTGYVELYLRQHKFDLYQRGRYLLPEDRLKAA